MPADDCPKECKSYPYCGCGGEARFTFTRSKTSKWDEGSIVRDRRDNKSYRSWQHRDMEALTGLMNELGKYGVRQ